MFMVTPLRPIIQRIPTLSLTPFAVEQRFTKSKQHTTDINIYNIDPQPTAIIMPTKSHFSEYTTFSRLVLRIFTQALYVIRIICITGENFLFLFLLHGVPVLYIILYVIYSAEFTF